MVYGLFMVVLTSIFFHSSIQEAVIMKKLCVYVIGYACKLAGEKSSYIIYSWKEKIDNRAV